LENEPLNHLQIGAEGSRHLRRYLFEQRAPGPDEGQVGERQVFIAATEANLHATATGLRLHLQQQPCFADASLSGHEHQSRLTAHGFGNAAG
jgi:hypothetical protein